MCSIRIFSIALCIFGKSDIILKAEVFMNVQYIKAKQLAINPRPAVELQKHS